MYGWLEAGGPPIRTAGLAAPESPEGSMKLRWRIDFCVENRSHGDTCVHNEA
jgi:hypothetical protein